MKNIFNKEFEIKQIITKTGFEEPSNVFSGLIMSIIKMKPLAPRNKYVPLLSPLFWKLSSVSTVIFIVLVTILSLFSKPGVSTSEKSEIITAISDFVKVIISFSINIVLIESVPIILLSVFLLLLTDHLFTKRLKTNGDTK